MVALVASVHALSFTCTLNMFLFEGTCTRSRKKSSVGLLGKSRTRGLRCRGGRKFKEQSLGHHPREQGSPVIVFCVWHFLLPQSVQDEIQVPAHRPQAATAASQLPLPKPTDGADATAHVPKRIDLRTWNSKQSVKHLPPYLKAPCPEHLEGVKRLICSPEKKKKGGERLQPDTTFWCLWGSPAICGAQRKRLQMQN